MAGHVQLRRFVHLRYNKYLRKLGIPGPIWFSAHLEFFEALHGGAMSISFFSFDFWERTIGNRTTEKHRKLSNWQCYKDGISARNDIYLTNETQRQKTKPIINIATKMSMDLKLGFSVLDWMQLSWLCVLERQFSAAKWIRLTKLTRNVLDNNSVTLRYRNSALGCTWTTFRYSFLSNHSYCSRSPQNPNNDVFTRTRNWAR